MKNVIGLFLLTILSLAQVHALTLSDAKARLADLEAKYQPQLAKPTNPNYESARADYFKKLADLYFLLANDQKNFTTETGTFLDSINEEIAKYPPQVAPTAKLFAGAWASPGHDFEYSTDGTWAMIPAEPGITGGTWTIKGFDEVRTFNTTDSSKTITIAIWLLTPDMLIEKDDIHIFFLSRITPQDQAFHWGYRK